MLAPQNLVFVAAGLLILVLLILEVVGSLVAASPSQLLDATLGADMDLDVEMGDALDPYHLGKVPWLVRNKSHRDAGLGGGELGALVAAAGAEPVKDSKRR
jgi:hypothetical protein